MKRNLYEKKCPICGKIFTVTNAEWVYKGRDKDEEGGLGIAIPGLVGFLIGVVLIEAMYYFGIFI